MKRTKKSHWKHVTHKPLYLNEIELLRRSGIANPSRVIRLITETISFLELDLSGLTVLTEAASGAYMVTPVIAALAGAERVIAMTADSIFASAAEVLAQTRALEALCPSHKAVEIHTQRSAHLFAEADIVTNLGFVRPIDSQAVAVMKPTAIIPLMCEAWEFRAGDVALEDCHRRGILVLGTNEDYPGLEVFSYSGWLGLKMLFEAQVEVHKSRIIIVGADKFGKVIERLLSLEGVSVWLASSLRELSDEQLASADALVVADYLRDDLIIGTEGDLTVDKLAEMNPAITVIQFAGRIDVQGLAARGISVYPGIEIDARRMAMTLASLGPRPVIELHAAGLKVGELAIRNRENIWSLLAEGRQCLLQEVSG